MCRGFSRHNSSLQLFVMLKWESGSIGVLSYGAGGYEAINSGRY